MRSPSIRSTITVLNVTGYLLRTAAASLTALPSPALGPWLIRKLRGFQTAR
jgi:hypothetical protein